MKKRAIMILCLIMSAICLCGCLNTNSNDTPAETVIPVSIITSELIWNGFRCVVPNAYVTNMYGPNGIMSQAATNEESYGLDLLSYYFRTGRDYSDWDNNPFTREQIELLLSVYGAEDQAEHFSGVASFEAGNGVICYHLLDEKNQLYASFAMPYYDEHEAVVMVGASSQKAGIDVFNGLVRKEVALKIKVNPSEITNLSVKRSERDDFIAYTIEGVLYILTEDPSISKDIADYELFGKSEDGITVYRLKDDSRIMLITDTEHDEPIIVKCLEQD